MKALSGTYTALITPFRSGEIDFPSLQKLIDQQRRGGVTGFVVNGTTAESPTLSEPEVTLLYERIRQHVGPDFPLIVGTGSNCTLSTCEATERAEKWGAQGVLVVVPYYNKPPQRGLLAHFHAVAESTKLPLLLYNVPGRTITSLELATIKELSKVRNIVGIKEASGKIEFAKEIREACGNDFTLLSGDDGTYGKFLEAGGDGVISVASHLIPDVFVHWTDAAKRGEKSLASDEISKYAKLIDLLFVEANPIPVKKAMQLMRVIESAELRTPLVEMDNSAAENLKVEMQKVGVLS